MGTDYPSEKQQCVAGRLHVDTCPLNNKAEKLANGFEQFCRVLLGGGV